jgi:glycosyltransferase involved in cell wall biosynthesis
MKKIRIAIVANSCWNIYNFRMELIQHWQLAGHEVIVIAPVDEYIYYLKKFPFVKHIPLRNIVARKISFFKDLILLKELFRIYKTEQPVIIFHFTIKPNIYGSLAARFLGIQSVSTITGLGYAFTNRNFKIFVHGLYSLALAKNKTVVFHNAADMSYFIKNNIVSFNRSLVIPGSGVDIQKFYYLPKTRDHNKTVYLFIGRILKDKGIVEFVKAAQLAHSIIKHAEFWIIGEFNPDSKNSISPENLVEWTESRIIQYHGNVQNVSQFIKESDIVVLPSYREGLPRAILEAMSMEKPVIVTDVPGCTELVQQEWNGIKVKVRDTHALSRAMVQLYNMSENERRIWGKNGRELVKQKYDVQGIVKAYDQFIISNSEQRIKSPGLSNHYEN